MGFHNPRRKERKKPQIPSTPTVSISLMGSIKQNNTHHYKTVRTSSLLLLQKRAISANNAAAKQHYS